MLRSYDSSKEDAQNPWPNLEDELPGATGSRKPPTGKKNQSPAGKKKSPPGKKESPPGKKESPPGKKRVFPRREHVFPRERTRLPQERSNLHRARGHSRVVSLGSSRFARTQCRQLWTRHRRKEASETPQRHCRAIH